MGKKNVGMPLSSIPVIPGRIQAARIAQGRIHAPFPATIGRVSLLLQESSSCCLNGNIFKLTPYIICSATTIYCRTKNTQTNTKLQIKKSKKNVQPPQLHSSKKQMHIPQGPPAAKLQGGNRTLILWRGVFASALSLAAAQLNHVEARKAVSPWRFGGRKGQKQPKKNTEISQVLGIKLRKLGLIGVLLPAIRTIYK